jgi:hypothetical protein
MAEARVVVQPSPFVLCVTAGSPAKIPTVTKVLHPRAITPSPKIQVGQQGEAATR